MKLRIQANSLRVRLTRGEVQSLINGQALEQITEFSPSSVLITRIQTAVQRATVTATFEGSRLTLSILSDLVGGWSQTDAVGIEADQVIRDGQSLHILIEKDFDCLHSRPEEKIDTFPNPKRLV